MTTVRQTSFSNRKFVILIIAIIGIIVIDISTVRTYDLVDKYIIPLQSKLILFSINSALCIAINIAILAYVRRSMDKNRANSLKVSVAYLISAGSICAVAILIGILTFQQLFYGYYEAYLSISVVLVTYGMSSAIISLLSSLFFSWYRASRDFVILLYFISFSMITLNLILTGAYASYKISERPDKVGEFVGSAGLIYSDKGLFLEIPYRLTSFGAFLSLWITTAVLMNNYRGGILSGLLYWFLIGIPLVFFILTFFFRPIFSSLFMFYAESDPVNFAIMLEAVVSLAKPIGGLVFGFAFWRISKIVGYERNIKTYMVISAWGIVLIVGSNQGELQNIVPYPPFGLATLAVLVTAGFLMLIGIYNSASLVSANNALRKFIYKHAMESRLLDVIGRAEMETSIENTVRLITSDTGIVDNQTQEPADLDEDELKKYLDQVVRELKKGHSRSW